MPHGADRFELAAVRLIHKSGGKLLHILEDIRAYKRNDPAARSAVEVLLLYNGLHATIDYRIALVLPAALVFPGESHFAVVEDVDRD